VVSCPNCKKGKSIVYGIKTTKCPWCGKGFKIFEDLILIKTDSEREAANKVAEINASISTSIYKKDISFLDISGLDDFCNLDSTDRLESSSDKEERAEEKIRRRVNRKVNREGKMKLIEKIAKELGNREFSEDDFRTALNENGIDGSKAEEYIKMLIEKNIIYEPRLGRYKGL